MKFAIVDDEPVILKQIAELIQNILSNKNIIIDTYTNSYDFLNNYTNQYSALFLDIDMPNMNGFALTEQLRNHDDLVPIVYITAREDLIIQAFRYKTLGFVRKQFIENELPYAISTIMKELHISDESIEITELRSQGGHTYRIFIREIIYMENDRHNVIIHMADGRKIAIRSSLSYFTEQDLFKEFVEISKGIIVNLSLVEMVEDTICLPDGERLYISRRKIPFIRSAYLKSIKKVLI